MARRRRLLPPGVTQHVVQRGVARQPCFFSDAHRHHYLGALREALVREGGQLHAYVLMTNHVHLLMTPARGDSISRVMQHLGRLYVRHVNSELGRVGPLWQGRFHAGAVDSDAYTLACHRYIEQNPVRAGMVRQAADFRWSSHAANASGEPDGLLTPHPTYLAIASSARERAACYRSLFRWTQAREEIERIRGCIARQHAFGGDEFVARVEALAGRRQNPGKLGRPPKRGTECTLTPVSGNVL